MPNVYGLTMTNYSNSYLDQFRRCPLSAHFKYDLRLRQRDEGVGRHHMEFSLAFHGALETLYESVADHPQLQPYYNCSPAEGNAILHAAQKTFMFGYPTQLDSNDWAKTQENGVAALTEYVKRWRNEDRKWKVLSTEQLDRGEDGFVVKLDLVVQDRETEQIYGVDHKVTGKYLNYDYFNQFEPNAQITEYVRFIKERYGNCDGFIINAIALRHRQRAYKGEPAGSWFAFERQTFNRNERQLEQGLTDRLYWIDRIEDAKAKSIYGMSTSQCRWCEYRDICKAGWSYPEDAELIDITYRRICGRWFGEPLQPCQLDREHSGEHAPSLPVAVPFEVEVEV